jgi:hypothetical protein
MGTDGATRFAAYPVSKDEAFVVRGYRVGGFVEATLTRDVCHHHVFSEDNFEPLELFALKRFRPSEGAAYSHYLGNLEDAAKRAAKGELGYRVHTRAENGQVILEMTGRLIQPDGEMHTEICHEQAFEDPDSSLALVQANEKAAELRDRAKGLNEQWIEQRDSHLAEVRAAYDRDDEQQAAAEELQQLVDAEDN